MNQYEGSVRSVMVLAGHCGGDADDNDEDHNNRTFQQVCSGTDGVIGECQPPVVGLMAASVLVCLLVHAQLAANMQRQRGKTPLLLHHGGTRTRVYANHCWVCACEIVFHYNLASTEVWLSTQTTPATAKHTSGARTTFAYLPGTLEYVQYSTSRTRSTGKFFHCAHFFGVFGLTYGDGRLTTLVVGRSSRGCWLLSEARQTLLCLP